jgi:hypothetical protein
MTYIHFLSYLAQFFLEWEIFQTKVVKKIKTHIFVFNNNYFFRKSCRLLDNVENCGAAGHTTHNMAHAHCMLDNWDYRHTLRICNTYCFSTATMVTRTRLNVTWYAHCLSCLHHTIYNSKLREELHSIWMDLACDNRHAITLQTLILDVL